MRLIVLHYHLRPGGIRRIIERATPHLARDSGLRIERVTLATGEAAGNQWHVDFAASLAPVPVECRVERAFRYFAGQRLTAAKLRRQIVTALKQLLAGPPGETIVWAHNLGLARNPVLAQELARLCAARGVRLVAHHHDWWFDNRWQRWPELRRAGFRTLGAAADAVLAGDSHVRHVAINSVDARVLRRGFNGRAGWLPNLTERSELPGPAAVKRARAWLSRRLGDGDAPVWLVPCRLLRRKNISEALLLTRWLRPEAWLVTTGAVSSEDEVAYSRRLAAAARRRRWRLRLGVLAGDSPAKPSVAELLAVSEVVLLTSIQEGFGLPFLEAVTARRPLIARSLPNIAPDLAQFGFRFPQLYEDVQIHPALFDWSAEVKRQTRLFNQWRRELPSGCRRFAGTPLPLCKRDPVAVPFSRLTLTAQLEVLAAPLDLSWRLCEPLNPWLTAWRRQAREGRLKVTPWPRGADEWLSGVAYAKRFRAILDQVARRRTSANAAAATQKEFLRERLKAGNLFPLLWSRAT